MTGIELSQCYPMLTSHMNPFTQLGNTLRGEKNMGDSVYTTLDADCKEWRTMHLEITVEQS